MLAGTYYAHPSTLKASLHSKRKKNTPQRTSQSSRKDLNAEKHTRAFSLTELLICLAITGILILVSYPSYLSVAAKSRRSDGLNAAASLQLAQEQFRSQCGFYAQNLGNKNVCGISALASTLQFPPNSSQGFYRIAIQASTATSAGYTIIIEAKGPQTADQHCKLMQIRVLSSDYQGTTAPEDCWR